MVSTSKRLKQKTFYEFLQSSRYHDSNAEIISGEKEMSGIDVM